jgi:hypothetical protein
MSPKKEMLEKRGDAIEFAAASLFQSQGFLVRRSLPLRLAANLDATDVDVFGVKFVYPFQPVRLICDCKDRMKSQAMERVFWAKGLSSCIQASEVYVAARSARSEVVQYASQHGVRVLTEEVLKEFIDSGAIQQGLEYSHADANAMGSFVPTIKDGIARDPRAKKLIDESVLMFHGANPFEDLNVSIDKIALCADSLLSVGATDPTVRFAYAYAMCNYIVVVSLQLLLIASETLSMTRQARKSYMLQRLTYGAMNRSQVHAILDAAMKFARRSTEPISRKTDQVALPLAEKLFQPPPYADDVVGLVERAIANPKMYHSLPAALDFVLFDGGLFKGGFDGQMFARVFTTSPGSDVIKATKNVFAFLKQHTPFTQSMVMPTVDLPNEAVSKDPVAPLPGLGI